MKISTVDFLHHHLGFLTDSISSSVLCSMDEVVLDRLACSGNMTLIWNDKSLCRVFPMLVLVSPGMGLLLLVRPSCGQGCLCRTFLSNLLWQFLRSHTFCPLKLGFDNFQQTFVCHFHLTISLRVS